MKLRFTLALLALAPFVVPVSAQVYPSPTFQVLTVRGMINANGGISGAGTFTTLSSTGTTTAPTVSTSDNGVNVATTANATAKIVAALPSATASQIYGGTGAAGAATPVNVGSGLGLSGGTLISTATAPGDLISRFRNGTMDTWQRGTSAITVATSGAYTADGWIALPTGASISCAQAAGRLLTAYSLKCTGAASVTDVILKQRIESLFSAALSGQMTTVQFQVYNGTGASITPKLTIKRPTAIDNYASTTTDVSAVNLQACANATWCLEAYTFLANSGSALGMEVSLDVGALGASATVQMTETDIRYTPGLTAGLNASPPTPQLRPVGLEGPTNARYFIAWSGAQYGFPSGQGDTNRFWSFSFPAPMRVAPTVVNNLGTLTGMGATTTSWYGNLNTGSSSASFAISTWTATAEL